MSREVECDRNKYQACAHRRFVITRSIGATQTRREVIVVCPDRRRQKLQVISQPGIDRKIRAHAPIHPEQKAGIRLD